MPLVEHTQSEWEEQGADCLCFTWEGTVSLQHLFLRPACLQILSPVHTASGPDKTSNQEIKIKGVSVQFQAFTFPSSHSDPAGTGIHLKEDSGRRHRDLSL